MQTSSNTISDQVRFRTKSLIMNDLQYPEGESNSYLEFRKLLFYPLNYRGVVQSYDFFANLPNYATLIPCRFALI